MTSPATLQHGTTRATHLARSPWIFDPLLGIVLGLPILGIGGRVAMRVIAHAASNAPSFSLGGTMTVVGLGALSGAAGGLIYALLARVMRDRAVLRGVIFGIILVLLTLRGTNPFTPLTFGLFLPLMLLYGAALHYIHRRRFT
jgi:hypothetical protein